MKFSIRNVFLLIAICVGVFALTGNPSDAQSHGAPCSGRVSYESTKKTVARDNTSRNECKVQARIERINSYGAHYYRYSGWGDTVASAYSTYNTAGHGYHNNCVRTRNFNTNVYTPWVCT